uniref:Uncharacterized protein n=1 Tax=Leersia perrieri TaxID=77586 RepID=A0A0D9VDN6_9ORYZ
MARMRLLAIFQLAVLLWLAATTGYLCQQAGDDPPSVPPPPPPAILQTGGQSFPARFVAGRSARRGVRRKVASSGNGGQP